jgi:AbrB family looped-hinge helix DNA binding protein
VKRESSNSKQPITVDLDDQRRITLPKAVYEQLGLEPGDEIEITVEERGVLLRSARVAELERQNEWREELADMGLTEADFEDMREIRKEVFRKNYPDLAHKYDI